MIVNVKGELVMALIICIECGKKFSDKAACCPECGCPTEIVLKNSTDNPFLEEKRNSSIKATETMLEYVKRAEERGKEAEALFDNRSSSIKFKARRNIDIFDGDATYRVLELQSDAREACDDLYTSYQMLVEELDLFCRPLLDASPGATAIKAVASAIKYFNDESEIESSFSASFEGNRLGNVANSKYVPGISSKMIQKYWESRYNETPEAIEEEKIKQKKREEQQKRREEEQKKEKERKRLEQQKESELLENRKKHYSKIKEAGDYRKEEYKKLLSSKREKAFVRFQDEARNCITNLKDEKKQIEERMKCLGPFSFMEKSNLKQSIEIIEAKIVRLSDEKIYENERIRLKAVQDDTSKSYAKEIESYICKRFPNIKESKETSDKYEEDSQYAGIDFPDMPNAEELFMR